MAQVGVHRHPDAPWSLRLFQRVPLNWTYHYLTYDPLRVEVDEPVLLIELRVRHRERPVQAVLSAAPCR